MKASQVFRELQERDPTKGSIVKNAAVMTAPLWANTVFWIFVNWLNLFWISQLGPAAIAAVAIGGTALMLLMVPIQGIVTASYGMVGSVDRGNQQALVKLIKQLLSITLFASLLIAAIGYFLSPILLRLLGTEEEVMVLAVDYLKICSIGGVVSFLFWPINGIVRATRDMFRPMLAMALVLGLQGVFDYLFILGNLGFPALGVAGAAFSVVFSAVAGTFTGIWMLARGVLFTNGKSLVKVNFRNWQEFKIELATLKEVIKIAGFDSLEGAARMFANMIMLGIVAPFGTPVLAAFAIGQRLFRYVSMFGMDLGTTAAITVSNNIGAGAVKRAEQSSWIISLINTLFTAGAAILFFIFANDIVGFFSQEAEVLSAGASYLRITVFGYIFFATAAILRRSFAGAKDTCTPMVANWVACVGLTISLALILPQVSNFGISGVWLAILLGNIVYGLILAVLFKLGFWKKAILRGRERK